MKQFSLSLVFTDTFQRPEQIILRAMVRVLELELGDIGSSSIVSWTYSRGLVTLFKKNQGFFSKRSPRFSPIPVSLDSHHILMEQDGVPQHHTA